MNDIDFIKWKIEKAGEPFKVTVYPKCTMVKIPGREHDFFIEDFEIECPDYIKSLLSQRAWDCIYTHREGKINDVFNTVLFKVYSFDSIDQAKESALKYIYEQETK
jgi:hypothetical protein